MGVEFSSTLLADIAGLTPADFSNVSAPLLGLVSSTQEPPPPDYLSRLEGRGAEVLQKTCTAQPGWEDVRRADELLLPGDVALVIASCLENTP
ncbi:MAG: hypothetical protein IPK82_26895 [Polyangiaceae bacterium]|nr:hypothetical protein [Polyangiaceae bacterium]